MEFTVESLEQAVTAFYWPESNQQAEAHRWLTKAQTSPEAWSFVWELLDLKKTFQVQFFAATTLHSKLMRCWNEVPQDQYEHLKKRILETIISYAMGPKIILNRLCIALSAFIIHTIPDHWPNAFEELVSSFQPHNLPAIESERVIWILLEILTVIPEEFQSTTITVTQRNKIRVVLQDVSKDILKVVEMCLMPVPANGFDMSNLTTYLTATKCGSAWMQLGCSNIQECDSVCSLLVDLICFVYWHRADPECISGEEMELSEIAVEALTAIIQHHQTAKYKFYVSKFAMNVLYKFEKIIEAERCSSEPNRDIVTNLYNLIITIVDTHSTIFLDLLKSPNADEQRITFDLLTSILKCTNWPGVYPIDETNSIMTFGLWYTLQDDILVLGMTELAPLLLAIKPYYQNLVCILLRKSMFPLLNDTSWSSDDKEVFRCYRQDISDTFMYCYNVLNLEMLDILLTKLTEALTKDNSNSEQPYKWNEIESCLHAFCAIAECIEVENLYLPKLMATLKEIPYGELHPKVMTTALETIGAYTEWFSDHPELLGNVLVLVISALGNQEFAESATMALKDITHNCQKFLLPYADPILLSAQMAIQTNCIKLVRRLMYSIGRVLSITSLNRVMEYLNVTLAPTFEDIRNCIQEAQPSLSAAITLSFRLKLLTALFGSLYIEPDQNTVVEQPVLLIMKNTMSYYTRMAELYYNNLDVMLDLSFLLKCVLTTLKDDCKPLIEDILQIVVTVYRRNPQAHILVVAKTVVLLFGKEAEFQSVNQQLVQEICNQTMLRCSKCNDHIQLAEITDLLEGFFLLLSNFIKKVPQLIFSPEIDSSALFQCAILCLVLTETATLKAVASFLVNFITQSREMSQVDIIHTYGESLVLRILLNLGTTSPRCGVDLLSDIILALNKKYCDNLRRWLTTLLTQENFPSPKITAQQKETFIKLVLKEKANKRKLCESVMEFALICKGIMREDRNLP